MTRPIKHFRPKKCLFGLKSGHGQPTVPPPTALLSEAVLFLNHCGCAGWSAPLLFATPKTVFLTSWPICFMNIKKSSTQVLF